MVDFKWIHISLFLIAVLQFPAAAEGLPSSSFTVRAGQEVTLPCENMRHDQQNCDSTTWIFSNSTQRAAVELIKLGQIHKVSKSNSDRLSVTQNCSLVIKKVTDEDVGHYDCQQYKSGQRQEPDSRVLLSVVTMTEHRTSDQVTLSCSVSTYGRCPHTVKWLYAGNNVDKDHKALQTSQSVCSASVTFKTSHFIHTSDSDLLKCEVTDGNKVKQFPSRLQPSGDDTRKTKPGPEPKTRPTPMATTMATKPTTKPSTPSTTEHSMKRGTITTASPINDDSTNLRGWWTFIIVSVGLAALIIIVVAVSMWTRTKGRKTQMDENVVDDDEDDGAVNYEDVTSSL